MFFVSGYRSSLRTLLTELRNAYCIGTVLCHETCALSCTNMDVDDNEIFDKDMEDGNLDGEYI